MNFRPDNSDQPRTSASHPASPDVAKSEVAGSEFIGSDSIRTDLTGPNRELAGLDLADPQPDKAIASPETSEIGLEVSTDVHLSGMNSALLRQPRLDTTTVELLTQVPFVPSWKPGGLRVATVSVGFPEGIEFLKKAESEKSESFEKIAPPKRPEASGSGDDELEDDGDGDSKKKKPKPKRTRLKPPADALSLEDRLFYMLQPPLEAMLSGQELIMPFEPFPYQYEGIAWLFSQDAALLADGMGLGKTMQTITAMRLLLRAGKVRRVLLICPKPLIPNWQREFNFWAEELPIVTVEGDAARRKMAWAQPNIPILIANYELMVRDMEALHEDDRPKFDLVVLDEAQRIKNRDSRTSECARELTRRKSWALTGTPIENRPEELVSLFEFLEVVPERATPDMRQLRGLADEYILRRTKDLVMKDLPPRIDRDAYIELSDAQRYTYDVAEKEGIIQLNDMGETLSVQHVFELVLRLKQISNFDPLTGSSSKLDSLAADMEEIAASGGKAILFSQWTKSLDWIAEKLDRFDPLIYHGGVPTKKREPILHQFEHDPEANLLLMSYGTGAVGLNLQFAGYVFLFDRWWNPAIEEQAINRAHRIGQKTQVIVTKFICKNTIEERIDDVLRKKRAIFDSILGDGDNENTSLSMNASEIFGLFDLKKRAGEDTQSIGPKAA